MLLTTLEVLGMMNDVSSVSSVEVSSQSRLNQGENGERR